MLGDAIGTFAAAKETSWNYELPEFDRPVASASVGVDGTCMLLRDDGWRVVMTGTIALYDSQGERLHTIRGKELRRGLKAATTYFRNRNRNQNQKHRMKYHYHTARSQPIESGVTEAACKVLIKQRFCRSGSRWKQEGASAVLSIHALKLTLGRWPAFWKRLSQYGYTPQSA